MTTVDVIIVIGAIGLVGAAVAAFVSTRMGARSASHEPGEHRADRPAGPAAEPMHPDLLGGDQAPPGPSAREN